MAATRPLSDRKPTVPAGMPNYDIAGNAQKPKTPQQIANEQVQANVGGTQQNTSNNTPTVQGDLISHNGVQTPIRQPAHEAQALEALQQQGNMSLAAQQQAAEAAMQQSAFTQQTAMQTAAQGATGQQGKDDMALLQARIKQENNMFGQRVNANNTQQTTMWDRIQGMGPIDGAEGRAIGNAPGTSPEEQAGRDAAFAREKDRIGAMGRGAVNSLAGLMSERGTVGGGYEQQGMADVVGGAQGQLGDVAREQTIQDLNRGSQISDRNYAGGIQRRGQDIQYRQALLQLMNSGGQY